ncbi:MAG TPA: DUF2079 domain-containing protein [Opitutaceae bacterium]|nr:DUF2079 domain-containing protein [Opitutaceae bacterium]
MNSASPRSTGVRALLARAFATPAPGAADGRRGTVLTLAAAAVLGAWMLAYKLQCFRGLAYTSDLFQFAQLATSWLRGHLLEDNCYGDHLSIHTYFLALPLAVFVVPAGPAGLLLALALAFAGGFTAIVRILRLFAVPLPAALAWGGAATIMPLSVHVYQDVIYGFHVELLMPALALWLAYFLLRRHWTGSLLLAVALLAVKEETPVLAAAVAGMVFGEDAIRGLFQRTASLRAKLGAINWPALAVAVVAVVALPVLLHILKSHPAEGYSPGNFRRIRAVDHSELDGTGTLLGYFYDNWDVWLRSPQVNTWLGFALTGTFGLIALRPHFLILGVGTTLIGWLMQDDLSWAPRLAPSLAFYQVAGVLSFASAYHLAASGAGWRGRRRFVVAAAALILLVAGFRQQLRAAARAGEFYSLHPHLEITPADRLQADALFAEYRRQRQPDEPVIASPSLFRYADYRSLYWEDRLAGRPTPVWMLRSYGSPGVPAPVDGYRLVGHAGRFALFRRDSP